MPRPSRGIGKFVAGAGHLLSSGLTISILWIATLIVVVGGIFETIQAWNEPWRTLFWLLFGALIFSLSVRVGRLVAAWLQDRRVESSPSAIESTTEELQQLGNALRALSEDLINLFFDFQPTPAMAVPPEKEPELAERYRRDFNHRVVHLYEEARERGFSDAEIERYYQTPNAFHFLALLAWRFRALADKVLVQAKAS